MPWNRLETTGEPHPQRQPHRAGSLEGVECAACSAEVLAGQRWCLYCRREVGSPAPPPRVEMPVGTVVATYCPSCGRLFAESGDCPRCVKAATPLKGGHCPRCGKGLFSYDADGVALDECDSCGGIWFDRNEIQRVLDLRVAHVPRTDTTSWPTTVPRVAPATQDAALPCVRCRARMVRRAVAPEAEVVADFCEHGLWLDGGELERFRGFVAGGGLARAGLSLSESRPRGGTWRRHDLGRTGSADGFPWSADPLGVLFIAALIGAIRR